MCKVRYCFFSIFKNLCCSILDIEIMETGFDRGDYRQSGSSLDSNNEKKKKNQKLFKFGMFK